MTYNEMKQGIQEASQTMRIADLFSNDFARMLTGRLRKVSPGILMELKKELSNFNAKTGEWKN